MLNRHLDPVDMSAINFVLDINIRGTLDFVRQCLPFMARNEPIGKDGERGVVIMVSSAAAYDGQPGQVSVLLSSKANSSLANTSSR